MDDDPVQLQMLTRLLEMQGHGVSAADGGQGALEKLKAGKFDIVICDETMEGMRGRDLAREVRKLNPEIGFVLVSGWGDFATEDDPDIGRFVDVVLSKPFRRNELAQAIRRVKPDEDDAG